MNKVIYIIVYSFWGNNSSFIKEEQWWYVKKE